MKPGGHRDRGPRSPWKTRYFLDTEFTDFNACDLISVAMVSEDGREFYGECADFERQLLLKFVNSANGVRWSANRVH
jgi:hypothetical protein